MIRPKNAKRHLGKKNLFSPFHFTIYACIYCITFSFRRAYLACGLHGKLYIHTEMRCGYSHYLARSSICCVCVAGICGNPAFPEMPGFSSIA